MMFALVAADVGADPLVIQGSPGSFVVLDFEGDFARFAGNGFAINVTGQDNPFHFFVKPRPGCDPCTPGDVWDPSFRTNGEIDLGLGNAQFGTESHPDVRLFGTLNFTAKAVAFEPPASEFFAMRSPFSFNAHIRGVAASQEAFAVDLVGTGTAFRVFDRAFNGTWVGGENQLSYRFADTTAPIPEPATLLLFGSGGALAAVLRRRQGR